MRVNPKVQSEVSTAGVEGYTSQPKPVSVGLTKCDLRLPEHCKPKSEIWRCLDGSLPLSDWSILQPFNQFLHF